jgi:hypothetical protein
MPSLAKPLPPSMEAMCISLPREVTAYIRQRAQHKKDFGGYVARLVWAEQAREEERARLRTLLDEQQR